MTPTVTTTTRTLDGLGRVTSTTDALGKVTTYTVDQDCNRTQMTNGAGTTTWGYYTLNRMATAQNPNNDQVSYAFDPVGNRASLTVNGTATITTAASTVETVAAFGSIVQYHPYLSPEAEGLKGSLLYWRSQHK